MQPDTAVPAETLTVAALYHFTRFDAPEALREPLLALCREQGVFGTLLLAREGINGTIAASRAGIDRVIAHIRGLPGCADLDWKESPADLPPFRRMKVKLKSEIVTMGVENVDPAARVGRYVAPQDWNALLAREDVVAIDTRNDYEVAIGTFRGAIDPETRSFRDFPEWWERNHNALAGKTVAMFCTGGIRCEKATSWLVSQGVNEVYHLKGGILKYLEDVPPEQSLWEGDCFVFDRRVSVGHGLAPGTYTLCHACRRPISETDKNADAYVEGVSCPACIDEYSEADRARFAERNRQMKLAQARGEAHLFDGASPPKR